MPALETAHALAHLEVLMPATNSSSIVIVNISGRGEKDLPAIMAHRSPVHAPQEG
jgi:tryptophan synthase beta subunit